MLNDAFETLFGIQYCYWVRMLNAHLDFTGELLP